MGNSILIIDNRQLRAQRLMGDRWADLEALPNVHLEESVPEESVISSFDVIAIHGSLISENHLEARLATLVKEKHVIIFSGAVSQMILSNEGRLLKVPAVGFYSQNLIPFCKYLDDPGEQQVQLLALVYGVDHCRLPILLQLRQLLWQYPEGERPYVQRRRIDELKKSLSLTDESVLEDEINKELLSL